LRTLQKFLEEKVATQSAQKNINLGILRPLLVPVPPLQEQSEIAAILLSVQQQSRCQREHAFKIYELKKAVLSELLDARSR
jgi:type I restriction enzyme S subunit